MVSLTGRPKQRHGWRCGGRAEGASDGDANGCDVASLHVGLGVGWKWSELKWTALVAAMLLGTACSLDLLSLTNFTLVLQFDIANISAIVLRYSAWST